MIFSTSGVAAQLNDITLVFSEIFSDIKSKKFAISQGYDQLKRREGGGDVVSFFNPNTIANINSGNQYYLILLNLVWDSAALGIHSVYSSSIEWILDTIRWVLENTNKTIVIRQHPVEREKHIKVSDNYKCKIIEVFGCNNRVIFVEAKSDISTYELIKKAGCIVGFSSTAAVESVALGKPAIIVSSAYYASLGIVYSAKNKKQYYDYLMKADNNKLIVTKDMRERAYICNYLTQTCNWIDTQFTPFRSDFSDWSKMDLESLINDNPIAELIELEIPTSIKKHQSLMKSIDE